MNIGIIIYSMTGNTAEVAKALAARFRRDNHEVDVKLLIATGMIHPGSRRFTVHNAPESEEIDSYDAIIFGSPVWLLRASPVILKFQDRLEKLGGKKLMNFVTLASPWRSLGGDQALKAMAAQLKESDGTVLPGESIRYFFGCNRQKLAEALDRIYGRIIGK